ncbi:Nif3-like dinuclear metal center hexameric protein [soil metagenome]
MAKASHSSADFHVWIDGDAPADPRGDRLDRWCVALWSGYPESDAEGWDQVGLHIGDPRTDVVTGVLVALDVTEAVLDEAAELGANLLIAHHPLFFSPLPRLTPHTASGRLALKAVRQGCAVLAAHTNVDKAARGTSHPAAQVLDLRDTRPIRPLPVDPGTDPVKIVTFVPHEYTDDVIRAMAFDGAGIIGNYTECAFVTPGTGTFRPGLAANPHVGSPGGREQVAEDRVEMVMHRVDVDAVLHHLRDAHPYEEVPYDLYPLVRQDRWSDRGLGLIGTLPQPLPVTEVARRLAEGLPSPHLRLAARDPQQLIRSVGICGGAGDSLIADLINPPKVDLFVTGDLKHHVTLDAMTMGLSLIDAGHFATEDPAMDAVVETLESARGDLGLTVPIHRSRVTTDPWTDWRPAP